MTMVSLAITLLSFSLLAVLAVVCLRLPERSSSSVVGFALFLSGLLLVVDAFPFAVSDLPYCSFWQKLSLVLEGLLAPSWVLGSILFARKSGYWSQLSVYKKIMVFLSFCLPLIPLFLDLSAFYYSPDFPRESLLFLTTLGCCYYIIVMICLVVAAVQFERTLINASPQVFWNIKFFIVGVFLILAVQIFYYSHALLYRTISMDFNAFRAFMFITASILMLYSFVKRDLTARITISQHIALRSIALIGVGVYLIILAFWGEGLKYLSGSFSRSVGISLVFVSGAGLLLVLFSGRVRREVKVTLLKHFYQNKYDYRTQWLLFTDKLSASQWDEMLQAVLEVYCDTFGVTGASLFLYDRQRQGYVVEAACRMDCKADVISLNNSLIRFMSERGWVFSVRDEIRDVMHENADFFKKYRISFVVPMPGDAQPSGFVVLGELLKSDEEYIYEDYDLMKTYAKQAWQTIRQQTLSRELLLMREEAAVGNVATFIMHDLKNQLSALSLMTENAAFFIGNPEYQKDLVHSLDTTVKRMRSLIGNLKTFDREKVLQKDKVDLFTLVEDCCMQLSGKPVEVSGVQVFVTADRTELSKVVLNILMNALEASDENKTVFVEVGAEDSLAFVRVRDQGCGMTQDFIRQQLFVPFQTTKPTGLGIGLFQSRQIMQAHDGKITVDSTVDSGSVVTVWLPVKMKTDVESL